MSPRIAVVGLPFFAERVAESLRDAGYRAFHLPRPGRSPRAWARLVTGLLRADLVYAIGSSIRVNSPVDLAARRGKPVLLHWVGTDVLAALEEHRAGRASRRLVDGAAHWADAPWCAEELAPIGIRAEHHPLPIPTVLGSPVPFPDTFRVLLYLSASPHAAYDVDGTLAVVRALPEIPFVVVGGYRPPEPIANLDARGFVTDMPSLYRETTVFVRLVKHDGMSHSVIEAMSFGRHVLWNYAYPGVTRVADANEAVEALRDLHARFAAGSLGLNEEGAREVTQRYRWGTLLSEIRTGIDRLLS
ncbi:MAG: glycosyltransferase [Chloroflexi bacterium]|nr:glycosyltransferase [Chloroflexota bacterium]